MCHIYSTVANILPIEKQVSAIHALAEGCSIRTIERMTGIHRDTIMRLGVRIGQKCGILHDQSMRGLDCKNVEIDEIWAYVAKKQRNVKPEEEGAEIGDAWTYIALDADTKLVPSYIVGKRNLESTAKFTDDLASRLKNRPQLSTDGMNKYFTTIEEAFGTDIDYGQIVKVYSNELPNPPEFRKYSPPYVAEIRKKTVSGTPDESRICTSHVERKNLTLRMHCRRLTRLTNAFSKKMDNLRAAISLHFCYYNFVLVHGSLRCTPAMAAGVTNRVWSVQDLILWGA